MFPADDRETPRMRCAQRPRYRGELDVRRSRTNWPVAHRPRRARAVAHSRRSHVSRSDQPAGRERRGREISNDSGVGNEPVLKGTRVTLKTVLASLAEGATRAEILADFPTLSEEDVRAAIAFVAGSAQEDMPLIETPIKR